MTKEELEKYEKEQTRKENLVKELYRENGIDPDNKELIDVMCKHYDIINPLK